MRRVNLSADQFSAVTFNILSWILDPRSRWWPHCNRINFAFGPQISNQISIFVEVLKEVKERTFCVRQLHVNFVKCCIVLSLSQISIGYWFYQLTLTDDLLSSCDSSLFYQALGQNPFYLSLQTLVAERHLVANLASTPTLWTTFLFPQGKWTTLAFWHNCRPGRPNVPLKLFCSQYIAMGCQGATQIWCYFILSQWGWIFKWRLLILLLFNVSIKSHLVSF